MGKISPNFWYHKVEKKTFVGALKFIEKEMKRKKQVFFCLSSHTKATWARLVGRGSIISLGLKLGLEFRLGGWGRWSIYIMYIDWTVRSVREMKAKSSASLTHLLVHSGSFALGFFEQ